MLQILKFSSLSLLLLFSFAACKNDPKDASKDSPKIDTIQMKPISQVGAATFVLTAGSVSWTGKKAMGATHQGTINVEKGEFIVNNNTLIKGQVTLDMNSLAVTDIQDAGERRDLESHLKDADFFEANKYPKAVFTIKEVLPSTDAAYNWLISGDLNMKGKSNSVNIPVKMTIEGDILRAESPTFSINRTQWGVNFHSGILGTAKDKLIDDNVMLSLVLEAKKS